MTEHIWQPLTVEEVCRLLEPVAAPWWLAGGQAIDAFLGYKSRDHGDIDVSCFRKDDLVFRKALSGLDAWCSENGTLRPWPPQEVLPAGVHDVWCRPAQAAPWALQLMIDESDGDEWVYRRNTAVRRPLSNLWLQRDGVRYLAVEVQLLYKAGRPGAALPPKNEADFQACLPQLDGSQRDWLAHALAIAHPGHPWRNALGAGRA